MGKQKRETTVLVDLEHKVGSVAKVGKVRRVDAVYVPHDLGTSWGWEEVRRAVSSHCVCLLSCLQLWVKLDPKGELNLALPGFSPPTISHCDQETRGQKGRKEVALEFPEGMPTPLCQLFSCCLSCPVSDPAPTPLVESQLVLRSSSPVPGP